jgi:signal transduction histidine kinase/DNA-binding NarL/FixJ family response regulator
VRLRHLQHYIILIMLGCALLLTLVFSGIAYQLIQRQVLEESQQLTHNLINAVKSNATAAVYAGNQFLGKDSISGLLTIDAIYSVKLEGFADESQSGMTVSGVNEKGGQPLPPIIVALYSQFGDDGQHIGELTVEPNGQWVRGIAVDGTLKMILVLVTVIFSACLVTAQLIKWFISKPLMDVSSQLQVIKPGGEERLKLPRYLRDNEIGALVAQFNTMLDNIKQAILVERDLRQNMELVRYNLEQAKEVAEHATRAKSNFLATMSHEIRTPMNSILGFLELVLESQSLEKEDHRHLQIAQTSAKFLLQLINDILDVSKIESGKLELEERPFDLAELLGEIQDLLDIKAREKDLQLNLYCPVPLEANYLSDPYRIHQILINLVGNAIKFTDKGRVDITVTRLADNAYEFSIVDTGIGIAADKIEQILKPFTQVDASISRQFGGTGLGTTISSELVELLGGELRIQSTFGKGSRFYFTITLEPCEHAPVVAHNLNKVQSLQQKITPQHILVVDDVAENIALTKIRLEKYGHTIEAALNGVEAVVKASSQRFDLILMDIQMPEMDGYEATRTIRIQAAHDGHNANVPIIALTANAMSEVQSKVIDAGMDEFVVKPIDFPTLFATISKVIPDAVIASQPAQISVADNRVKREGASPRLIDFNSALASWLDEDAFYTALHSFAQRNTQTVSELCGFIGMGDNNNADIIVHKVKGAAGNLRLRKLYNCSCSLEASIKSEEQHTINIVLKPFVFVLNETLAAINALPKSSKAEQSSVESFKENLPQCTDCFLSALDACEQHDPDAAEAAIEKLGQYIEADQLAPINSKLQLFDFSQASAQLNQLADELEIEVKIP